MFTRVYNYAKQKHIPASFLMKFRYLIEREGKIRRTVAVMGTVLRNSKWADKSYTNINPLQYSFDLNHYFHLFIFVSTTVTFFLLNTNNIFLTNLFGASNIWWFIEADFSDWSKTFVELAAFIIPAFLFLGINISSNMFLFSTSANLVPSWLASNSPSTTTNNLVWDNLDLKTWPTLKGRLTTPQHDLLSEFQLDKSEAKFINYELEYYLYNTLSLNLSNTRPLLTDTPLIFTYPQAYELLNQKEQSSRSKKKNLFTPLTIHNSDSTQSQYFYFTNVTYQNLNLWLKDAELVNLSTNLHWQGQVSNSLRWAYRYNNLHRRSIYNSHKLTESKKLLSGGYFDSSSTLNNLWFSDQYARDLTFKKRASNLGSLAQIRSNWNLLYRSVFTYSRLNESFKAPTTLSSGDVFTRLSCYESSFHFFLNRIKFFSSLRNHTIKSLPRLGTQLESTAGGFNNLELLYSTTLNGVLKNESSNFDGLTNFSNFFTTVDNTHSGYQQNSHSTATRDLLLVSQDKDLLTYHTNLLFNLTNNLTTRTFYYTADPSTVGLELLPTKYNTNKLF